MQADIVSPKMHSYQDLGRCFNCLSYLFFYPNIEARICIKDCHLIANFATKT